ncbi:MAG: helix-turn-helix domain-containing protein [Ruminococcus sp.]|nr:helix-turn-helix domain-containing protein [Ruminococcus sp.]
METKEIIHELRTRNGMSQDALAEKVFVTRQAVSRWENGDTVPNTETLKLLSRLFDVSINTLLGSPEQLYCQCCGMPLEDGIISREKNGDFNEGFCKWCYADGEYMYSNIDDLIDVCVKNMADAEHPEDEVREYLKKVIPELGYWKNHSELSDGGRFEEFKSMLIEEINALGIEGMPKLTKLNALVGGYVNLAYKLPGGAYAKFLDDGTTYLGNQLEGGPDGRCYGVLANMDFILISTYGKDCADPELLLYKKR